MINPVIDAMVSGIKAGFASQDLPLMQCQRHGGPITMEQLQTYGANAPAVLVAVLRLRNLRKSGRDGIAYDLDMGAYPIATPSGQFDQHQQAARMIDVLLGKDRGILPNARWGRTDCLPVPLDSISASNLYSGTVGTSGLALWGIAWHQPVDTNPNSQPNP